MHFHKYTPWKPGRTISVYEYSSAKYPMYREQVFMKVCTVCGNPKTKKVRI